MAKNRTLLHQLVRCEVIRVEVASVASEYSLSAILCEVASVDRKVFHEKLLDNLRSVVRVTSIRRVRSASHLNQFCFAVETRCEQEVLTRMETHGADHTLVLRCSICIS